ncbi:MAG: hypothetical protein SCH71_06495 [Desulfobulbaceae bacterium]|nr:hypothetical protein [Desulfobulbaceae bacterium]
MSNLHTLTKNIKSSAQSAGEQTRIACSPQVVTTTGVDKLKVCLWVDWFRMNIFDRLRTHKLALQESNHDSAPFDFDIYQDHYVQTRYNFNLMRTGTARFSYRLISGDVALFLSPRSADSVLHNVQLEIGSLSCQTDFKGVFDNIIKMFHYLSGKVEQEIVSEVHLACDLLGVPIAATSFHYEDNWICRSNNFTYHSHRRKFNSMSLGKGDIMLRVYDKLLEMSVRRDTAKQEFFAKKWGLSSPEDLKDYDVTRVEFQLRRPVLKEFDIPCNTVHELSLNLQSIWIYLTESWCRFCVAPVDRAHKNQSRSTISEMWEKVQNALFFFSEIPAKRVRQVIIKSIDPLYDQVRGLMMTIAASKGHAINDIDFIVKTSQQTISYVLRKFFFLDEVAFQRKMQQRFNECYATVL